MQATTLQSLGQENNKPLAGEWASAGLRWWARDFDLTLWLQLLSVVWSITAVLAGWNTDSATVSSVIVLAAEYIILVPAALFIDSFIYARFGNTPGKALLGLTVEGPSGEKLSATEYRVRNFKLWGPGLGFGFLPLALIAQFLSYRKLKNEGYTAWDKTKGYAVKRHRMQLWKVVVFIVVMLFWQLVARMATSILTQEAINFVAAGAVPAQTKNVQIYTDRQEAKSAATSPNRVFTATPPSNGASGSWDRLQTVSVPQSDGTSKLLPVWFNPITKNLATLPDEWNAYKDLSTPVSAYPSAWKFSSERGGALAELTIVVFEKSDAQISLQKYANNLLHNPAYLSGGEFADSVRSFASMQETARDGQSYFELYGVAKDERRQEFVDVEVFKGKTGYWSILYIAYASPGDPLVRGRGLADAVARSAS
jgi:uncharacterized RDD family membrane protein YckC